MDSRLSVRVEYQSNIKFLASKYRRWRDNQNNVCGYSEMESGRLLSCLDELNQLTRDDLKREMKVMGLSDDPEYDNYLDQLELAASLKAEGIKGELAERGIQIKKTSL